MEKLQWYFELIDRVSGPAGRGAQALARLDQSLGGVGGGLRGVGQQARSSGGGLESWVTKANSAIGILGALAGAIRSVTGEITGMGVALGRVVLEQASFFQSTMTTFNTLLQAEHGGGAREFGASLRLANLLPGSTEQFVSQRTDLVTGGFTNRRQRDVVFAMVQDLAAMRPRDTTVGERVGLVLSQIQGQRTVNMGDLNQLTNAGIGRGDFLAQIARMRGVSGTEDQQIRRAMELVSGRQVSSDEAFNAIANIIESRTHTRLGGFAAAQGDSIAGVMSNLESAPQTLLLRMFQRTGGFENMAGGRAFLGFMRELNEAVTGSGPRAQRLLGILERLVNGVFGALFRQGDGATLIDQLLDVMERLVPVVVSVAQGMRSLFGPAWRTFSAMMPTLMTAFGNSGNAEWFQQLMRRTGEALGVVAGIVVWLIGLFSIGLVVVIGGVTETIVQLYRFIVGIPDRLGALGQQIQAWWQSFSLVEQGRNLILGLATGIHDGAAAAWDAIRGVGSGIVDSVTGLFDMHSPSRLMMRYGGFIAGGLALGIAHGAGDVDGALAGIVPSPATVASASGLVARSGAGGVAPGGIQVSIQFALPEGVHDPAAIGEAVRPVVLSAIAEALDRAAIEAGVG